MSNLELSFEAFGAEHSGPPLIILHGFFACARNWRGIARLLAARRPVYILDQRNHGGSPHHPVMDYPALAADVTDFMDQQGFAQADIVGHSMGGKVAMWLALHNPKRVHKLIIADIAPVSYRHSFDHTIQTLRQLPLSELRNRKQAEQLLAGAHTDIAYIQFLLQNLQLSNGAYYWRVNLDYFAANAANIVAFPEPACEPYPAAALFLAGENSAYVQAEAIYALFPQATLVTLKNAGHWLQVDAPAALQAEIEAWLA